MIIPQPGENVGIVQQNGEQLPAVVESVALIQPKGVFLLKVRVPRPIPRREQIDLVTAEGVFHLAAHESDGNMIELRAYEGMRADPR